MRLVDPTFKLLVDHHFLELFETIIILVLGGYYVKRIAIKLKNGLSLKDIQYVTTFLL